MNEIIHGGAPNNCRVVHGGGPCASAGRSVPGGGLPDGGYAGPGIPTLDDLAQRLTAMGHVLAAAVAVVAAYEGGNPDGYVYLRASAFRALADAVERAQPGAVEATRKALGR